MNIEQQLKSTLGIIGYRALLKLLRKIEITIDGDFRELIVYQHNKEPLHIKFEDIEDFINNVH